MIRVLPVTLALLLSAPACAQRQSTHVEHRGETHIVQRNNDHRLEIRMRGDVEVNDEGNWVQRLGPGGSLRVEERTGGTTRRAEFTPGQDGRVQLSYAVNGRAREMDAAGREWARAAIIQAVRSSGLGARQRVARLRERGGVSAVLDETRQLRSEVVKRAYYQALFAGEPLSSAEMQRVMADVGRMDSDVERRIVLVHAMEHARGDGAMPAILNAAGEMDSDVETRIVLHRALERGAVTGAARTAFLRAVDGIGSDVERRIVLTRWVERGMGGEADAGFFRAVDGMDSDVERRIVLTRVLDRSPSQATIVAALNSAARMDSDVEKRMVLMRVPDSQLRNPRVTAAYRAVVDRMNSDHERSTALRRLARGS